MSMPGLGRIRQAQKWLRNQLDRKALILLYHRVANVDSDPWNLCVSPRHFAQHLEVLRQDFRPMPLQQLVQSLRQGKLPRRAIAITFDDGYADNLYNAKPFLERYDIPATVFVTTGQIGCEREFWWDEAERLFLQPGKLPEALRFRVNGITHEWRLGDKAQYGEEDYRRNRRWKAWEQPDPSPRHTAYRSMYKILHPLPAAERLEIQDELLAWAGAARPPRPTHRSMALDEIKTLAQAELVGIGAHTVTHPALSGLGVDAQRHEVRQSKAHLEEVIGRPVIAFSYPHGSYTRDTVDVVRQAGFSCAGTSCASVVTKGTDPFQLPRRSAGDWDGENLSRRLAEWFRG